MSSVTPQPPPGPPHASGAANGPLKPVVSKPLTSARPIDDDAFDDLAAMFLTGPQPAEATPTGHRHDVDPPTQQETRRAETELLITGHLPVRGGLWLTPFADALARQCGSCALMRIDGPDEFAVHVLRGRNIPPRSTDGTLRDIIGKLSPTTRVWVVSPRGSDDHSDRRSLVTAGADRLTILSSADDMAVVAAYQLIKELAAAANDAGRDLPELSIAVVGADQSAAERMVQRVNQTAAMFLAKAVTLRLALPRIDSNVHVNQHISFAGEPCPPLRDIVGWISEATDQRGESAQAPRVEPAPASAAPAAGPAPRNGNGEHRAGRESVKLSPKAAIELESRQPAQSSEPERGGKPLNMAAHVKGLTALPVRCPGSEHVEIAVDASGNFHVLATERNLRDLHIVRAWVKSHRELLRMACRDHTINPHGDAVCHLVTSRPASVADLHGTDVRLHVLAPVEVDGRRGWYAAPLS